MALNFCPDRTTQSARTHMALTQAPAHTSTLYKICNTNLNNLKTVTYDESRQQSQKGKHGGSIVLEKEVLRLDLKESRKGFFRRGRGRPFHVEWLKSGKVWVTYVGQLSLTGIR